MKNVTQKLTLSS